MRRSSVAFLLIVLTLISPVSQSHAQHAAQDNGSMSNRIGDGQAQPGLDLQSDGGGLQEAAAALDHHERIERERKTVQTPRKSADSGIGAVIHSDGRPHVVRPPHRGAVLQIVPDDLQLHQNRANRRSHRACGRGRIWQCRGEGPSGPSKAVRSERPSPVKIGPKIARQVRAPSESRRTAAGLDGDRRVIDQDRTRSWPNRPGARRGAK